MLPFPHKCSVPLKTLSTLGVGGPARFVTTATTTDEMAERIRYCAQHSLPFLVLGLGSNCLFDDRGYPGLIILNKIAHLSWEGTRIRVGGGYSFARLGGVVSRCGYTGLEFASGIPASVGGAIFMNAGAGGQEVQDVIEEVGFIDAEGALRRYTRSELTFAYRHSSFHGWKGAIVEGVFVLTPSEAAKQTQKTLLGYRLKTQPYSEKSAGCAFRNPEKIPAGKLIEELGLKGLSVGGARVSDLHGNFLVNAGDATSADMRALITKIQEIAQREKGIALETEIRYIPYDV